MNYTPNTSPQENYEALCHFMEIEDGISDVLMLYVLTSLLRPLYHKAGFKCNYILNLVGKTQSRKTTLAQLASDFFYDGAGKTPTLSDWIAPSIQYKIFYQNSKIL